MLNTASKVAIGLAVPVGLYAIVLGTLMTPYFQRLYDPLVIRTSTCRPLT